METEELQSEIEDIKKRQGRFGETEESKFNLEQIAKAIEFKVENIGNPQFELKDLFVPLPTDNKRVYNMLKQKRLEKRREKFKKDKNSEDIEPKKAEWWKKK